MSKKQDLNQTFTIHGNEFTRWAIPTVGTSAWGVYCALKSHTTTKNPSAFTSTAKLAVETGLTETTVKAKIHTLESAGFLHYTDSKRPGGGLHRTYHIHNEADIQRPLITGTENNRGAHNKAKPWGNGIPRQSSHLTPAKATPVKKNDPRVSRNPSHVGQVSWPKEEPIKKNLEEEPLSPEVIENSEVGGRNGNYLPFPPHPPIEEENAPNSQTSQRPDTEFPFLALSSNSISDPTQASGPTPATPRRQKPPMPQPVPFYEARESFDPLTPEMLEEARRRFPNLQESEIEEQFDRFLYSDSHQESDQLPGRWWWWLQHHTQKQAAYEAAPDKIDVEVLINQVWPVCVYIFKHNTPDMTISADATEATEQFREAIYEWVEKQLIKNIWHKDPAAALTRHLYQVLADFIPDTDAPHPTGAHA